MRPAFFFPFFSCLLIFAPHTHSDQPIFLPSTQTLPIADELPQTVKVALVHNESTVELILNGNYAIYTVGRLSEALLAGGQARGRRISDDGGPSARFGTLPQGDVLIEGAGPLELRVEAKTDGVGLNGEVFEVEAITIRTAGERILVGKRAYLGDIQILKKSPNSLVVINHVNLDTYLKGILPLEVSPDWPIESLKAHAVVSRTFALFMALEKKGQEFALYDTVKSQMYGGALFHKEATDQAIDATHGEVLTFKNEIFPAFFHANCGGHTAPAGEALGREMLEPLSGVKSSFCKGTKHYEWNLNIPLSEIQTVMQQNGYPATNLKNVQLLGDDGSGRVTTVEVQYELSSARIRATDFRAFVGYDKFRSLRVQAELHEGAIQFRGFGWGHGVGFCQWGAKGQAELGTQYREMLQFYYPGSALEQIYK
jgi:stage II sporulation protein D